MVVSNMLEAKTNLSLLVQRAIAGEDVLLARNGQVVARIVPSTLSPRRIGVAQGRYAFPADFDEQFDALDADVADMFDGATPDALDL